MRLTASQLPYEPRVDGSESKLAFICSAANAFNVIEYPFDFCCREIRIDHQPCYIAYVIFETLLNKVLTDRRGPFVLPHNRIINRFSAFAIPDHRRLSLIGDADGSNG